ncbi:hypothetical protein FRC04_004480 [Tulasnella sp. 424]|nr:hypothetical protein FRC04_004480 [Tulasnella sp. 424]KAG8976549.1 hypothetical protein FRC05_003388 [Tulasnella sp. 425]
MASVPPHQPQGPREGQQQLLSSTSQYSPPQQQQHSGSAGYAPQTAVPPHFTQIHPGVGPSGAPQPRVPPQTAARPAAMAHPQQQPQLAGSSNSAMPNGGPAYIINQQEQMNRQVIEYQRRLNDLQARNNSMVAALQTAQRDNQIHQRNYTNLLTSWNEYKDANDAYKAEHERDTQRIKDLDETLAAKSKLVDQGWAAMSTWKDAHQKEAKKVEEMTLRIDKLGEQLNQTHLEGMQWKACALSWNDPKGEFQQALVQAISSRLGEQYRARERVHLERIRELEHQVNAYRRMFPNVQLPPLPPPPPPPPSQAQHPQAGPSGSNQQPPQTRPVPPPLSVPNTTTAAQSPTSSVAPPDRRGSASTNAASPGAPYVASPAAMQARVQHQYQQARGISPQQPMPGPGSSSSSSRPSTSSSVQQRQQHPHQQQQQQQGVPQAPSSVPLPSTQTFPTPMPVATGAPPPMRHAVRIVGTNSYLPPAPAHVPTASPTAAAAPRRASLPIPSPSQQLTPHQLAQSMQHATLAQISQMDPRQFGPHQRTASGSSAPPSSVGGPTPSKTTPIYFTNGRQAGFVAQRPTPAIPQKRPSSSEVQQQPPQSQPPPVPELDLDDVIEIPAEDAATSMAHRRAGLEEEGRLKKRARLDGVEKDKDGGEGRDASPDIPLSEQRRDLSPDVPLSAQRADIASSSSVDASAPHTATVSSQTSSVAPPSATIVPPSVPHPNVAPIMTRNQRTDSTASNMTIVPPAADGSVSPPPLSPGLSSRRASPEIGRLVPVVLTRTETEDDHDEDKEEPQATNGQGDDVVMSVGEVQDTAEAPKQANAMDLDEPGTPASAGALLEQNSRAEYFPPQQQQASSSSQPPALAPPPAPPIAVLLPDEPQSPSLTEPGELKESPVPVVKSELVDELEERQPSSSSLEEGEVSPRTPTPAAPAAAAEAPAVAIAADVTMEDASRQESEDVKPVIGPVDEIVPKIEETTSSEVTPAPNGLVNMAVGSQQEPIEILEEQTQDSIIIDFLAVLFGVAENDDTKVECQLCSRRGNTEKFDREDLGALVCHCEKHHQRAWKVRVLDVLDEQGIPYVPSVPATA